MMLLGMVTAISLAGLQATINVPRDAFRDCLKGASVSAKTEKVVADLFEDYARGKCSVQADTLKKALVAFDLKNGMAKKAAASDADMTIEDYLASPVDKYRVMNPELDKPAPAAAQPAAEPSQPKQ